MTLENEFDQLTNEAKAAMDMTLPLTKVTNKSLKATQQIRDFKAQGTQGLLECRVRSIIKLIRFLVQPIPKIAHFAEKISGVYKREQFNFKARYR